MVDRRAASRLSLDGLVEPMEEPLGSLPIRLFRRARTAHAQDVACLTSLRFFAAAWVLALHYSERMPVDGSEVTAFFVNGRLGVDFFFVLSGFILTHVYLRQLQEQRFSFRAFIQKRFARLYPLHLVMLLVVLAYVSIGGWLGIDLQTPAAYSWEKFWHNLLMIHAWGLLDSMSWNYVAWSISAEWFAYLLFLPLGLAFLRWPGGSMSKLALASAVFTACYLATPLLVGQKLTLLTYDFAMLRIIPEFLLGMGFYHVSLDWDLDPAAGRWLMLGLLTALLGIVHFDLGSYPAVLLLGCVIFAAASLERQGGMQLLRRRGLVYLGETSYALYMTHAVLFILYFKAMAMLLGDRYEAWVWQLGPVALVAAFLVASLGYHLIEVPGRRWLTSFHPKPRPSSSPLGT
jgi:peptidoglycan/LPS O-acetylase OafA/YrhL